VPVGGDLACRAALGDRAPARFPPVAIQHYGHLATRNHRPQPIALGLNTGHAVGGGHGSDRTSSGEKDHLDHTAHHGDDHDADEDPELALIGGAYLADLLP